MYEDSGCGFSQNVHSKDERRIDRRKRCSSACQPHAARRLRLRLDNVNSPDCRHTLPLPLIVVGGRAAQLWTRRVESSRWRRAEPNEPTGGSDDEPNAATA